MKSFYDCYHEDTKFFIVINAFFFYLHQVSSNCKKGYAYYTRLSEGKTKWLDNILTEEILNKKEKDLEWLSGFSEAESLFFISHSGALSFKIKLHWDDRQTLVYIKNILSELADRKVGIILDWKDKHESYYSVSKFKDIIEIIIPIFLKYYFTTSKFLDFQDFKTAAEIKIASFIEKRKIKSRRVKKNIIIKIRNELSKK